MTPIGELPGIKEWIESGDLVPTAVEVANEFAAFLESHYPFVPVTGYSIDWARVPGSRRLRWDTASPEEVVRFVNGSPIGAHSQIALWFRRSEPCYVCDLAFAASRLDELLVPVFGERYLFGAGNNGRGEPVFFWNDFIEAQGMTWLSSR